MLRYWKSKDHRNNSTIWWRHYKTYFWGLIFFSKRKRKEKGGFYPLHISVSITIKKILLSAFFAPCVSLLSLLKIASRQRYDDIHYQVNKAFCCHWTQSKPSSRNVYIADWSRCTDKCSHKHKSTSLIYGNKKTSLLSFKKKITKLFINLVFDSFFFFQRENKQANKKKTLNYH